MRRAVLPGQVFTEQDETIAKPRAMLTARACRWAVQQIRREHGSVSGLARQLGVEDGLGIDPADPGRSGG